MVIIVTFIEIKRMLGTLQKHIHSHLNHCYLIILRLVHQKPQCTVIKQLF